MEQGGANYRKEPEWSDRSHRIIEAQTLVYKGAQLRKCHVYSLSSKLAVLN